jgi:acetyl-CoA carboxylase biotin carboxyl carrier protein
VGSSKTYLPSVEFANGIAASNRRSPSAHDAQHAVRVGKRRSTVAVQVAVLAEPVEDAGVNLNAHITGTVWKIEVKEGDTVAEGQTCVILESMKMEMPLEAPQAGKVEKITCKEGQAVNEGDVLLVIA